MTRRVAIAGIGYTPARAVSPDVSYREMIHEAASGGLLGVGNPIAAAGLMKICELFWQLRGDAGPRQVKGNPKRGVAQAWGDLMQVGTVVVMGR